MPKKSFAFIKFSYIFAITYTIKLHIIMEITFDMTILYIEPYIYIG